MITGYILLRALVILRRISKSLVRSNEIAEARFNLERDRLALEHPVWYKSGGKMPTPTKRVVFGTATVAEWNQRHRERNPDAQDDQGRP
jgi:hypothetical protein